MKKLLVISTIFILFLSMAMVTAVEPRIKDPIVLDPTGSFLGYIGMPKQQDPIIIGNISGEYKMRNRGGGFSGTWDINLKNHNGSGTIRGLFGKHIFLGKLSIEGFNRSLPVIGFIGFNTENQTFKGRAMSIIGPAPYFWGTFEPY